MDSLLATYASSDEDDADLPRQQSSPNPTPYQPPPPPPPSASASASASAATLLKSLPPPKSSSSSLFGFIPDPKSRDAPNRKILETRPEAPMATSDSDFGSGRLFDSLPQPRSRTAQTLENETTFRDGGGEDLSLDGVGERSGLFPALPAPKFSDAIGKVSLNLPAPKKVVQFKPPVMSWGRGGASDDDEEEDEVEKDRKRHRELQ